MIPSDKVNKNYSKNKHDKHDKGKIVHKNAVEVAYT